MLKGEVLGLLHEYNLSHLTDRLEYLMLPAIRIKPRPTEENRLQIGTSKFGGLPDFPPGFDWPKCENQPLHFLAQFRLDEIVAYQSGTSYAYQKALDFGLEAAAKPYHIESELPSSGMLYFFYDASQQSWGYDPKDRGRWRVLYYQGKVERLYRTPGPTDIVFNSCALTFSKEWMLPDWDSMEFWSLDCSLEEDKNYRRLSEEINLGRETEYQPHHHLLGHPMLIQGEMRKECQLAAHGINCLTPEGYRSPEAMKFAEGTRNWRLLLQLDSDRSVGWMWGDVGKIYFWIQEDMLREQNFDNVWLILECY